MTEQSFTTELIKWAKTYKWRVHHIRNSGFGGNTYVQGDKGFPDLVLVRPPRLIFAELKIEKKKPTTEQEVWLDAFRHCQYDPMEDVATPIEVYVWRPENWLSILAVLSAP